jgi:hypothetical protein
MYKLLMDTTNGSAMAVVRAVHQYHLNLQLFSTPASCGLREVLADEHLQ